MVARLWREQLAGDRDNAARLWAILVATRWLERRAQPQPVMAPTRSRKTSA
jgi:hypothetical protein